MLPRPLTCAPRSAAPAMGRDHTSVVQLLVARAADETAGAAFLRTAARARELLRGLAASGPTRIVFLITPEGPQDCCDLTRSLTVFSEHANRRYGPAGLRFSVQAAPVQRYAN